MLEIALMIEGQNGLTWKRWIKIAEIVEKLGFVGLYRSDHFTNNNPPDKESLELWTSLTWLASHTENIEFGPMVSPVSFRNPTLTARMAAAVDDLSGGRLTLGIGAGWQEREHNNFGFGLLNVKERFKRFEEATQVIIALLNSDEPSSFAGEYYKLEDAILLPRPKRAGGPPILIGGNGPKLTLPMVAKYATEWNCIYLNPSNFAALNMKLDQILEDHSRKPEEVKRSMMTGIEYGRTEKEARDLVSTRTQGKLTLEEFVERGPVAGNREQVIEQLEKLQEAGLQRVMLQWLALDDTDRLIALGEEILPHFRE